MPISTNNPSNRRAYIITGPTSGFGRATAFEVAKHGTIVLVGRGREKLDALQKAIEQRGGCAVAVVCDLSDVADVRRTATAIINLNLPLAGLVNNAGIMQIRPTKSAQGLDMSYATNHLGPFGLTEALIPHLPDGANVVFIASAVEDPERKPAELAGFRGARYISAEASARGEWKPGGPRIQGTMPMPRRNSVPLPRLWSSPAKHLAFVSTRLSLASVLIPVSGETRMFSSAS